MAGRGTCIRPSRGTQVSRDKEENSDPRHAAGEPRRHGATSDKPVTEGRVLCAPPAHVPPSLCPGVTSQIGHWALNVRVCFWGNQSREDELACACIDGSRFYI